MTVVRYTVVQVFGIMGCSLLVLPLSVGTSCSYIQIVLVCIANVYNFCAAGEWQAEDNKNEQNPLLSVMLTHIS